MALTEATKEAIYLKIFLLELNQEYLANIYMYADSMSAIILAQNPTYHASSKHIDIHHHFVNNGEFKICHTRTEDMVYDILTKSLSPLKHFKCLEGRKFGGV